MAEELKVVFSANPDDFIAGVRKAAQSLKDFDSAQKTSAQKTLQDIKDQILQQARLNQLRRQAIADLKAQASSTGGISFGGGTIKGSDLPSEITSGGKGISALIPKWFLWFQAISLVKDGLRDAGEALVGFIKDGVEFDAQLELARVGIGSLIAAQTKQIDASGKQVDMNTALINSYGVTEDQLNKLRVAGLQTVATTKDLVAAFQIAVAPGLGAGMSLDEVRKTTVEIVQASTALGVPLDHINEQVKALFTGIIDHNARLAKALNITTEMVNQWRQQGTLAQELQKRLESFRQAGEVAAQTFTGVVSNLKEAFDVLAGDAVRPLFESLRKDLFKAGQGIFDFDTAQIADKFRPIIDVAQKIFREVGDLAGTGLAGAVEGAKELADWFRQNDAEVSRVIKNVFEIAKQLGGIVVDVTKAWLAWQGMKTSSGAMADLLGTMAITIALIRDGVNAILHPIDTLKKGLLGIADVLLILVEYGLKFQKAMFEKAGASTAAENVQKSLDFVDKFSAKIESMKELQDTGATGEAIEAMKKFGDESEKAGEKLKLSAAEAKKQLKELDAQIAELTKKMKDLQARGLTNPAGEVARQIQDLQNKRQEVALAGGLSLQNLPQAPNPKDLAKAANDLKQMVDGMIAELKKAYEAQKADLDEALDQSLISYKTYFEMVTAAQKQEVEKQIALKNKLLSSPLITDAGERSKLKSEIQGLQDSIETFRAEQSKKMSDEMRKLQNEVLDAEAQTLQEDNQLQEAFLDDFAKKWGKVFNQLEAESDEAGKAILKHLMDTGAAKAKLQEFENAFSQTQNGLSQLKQGLDLQVQGGQLFQSQADVQFRNAQLAKMAELENDIVEAQKAADATGDGFAGAAAQQRVEGMRLQLQQLKLAVDQDAQAMGKLKQSAEDALRTGLSQALLDVTSRAKNMGQAFRDVLKGIADSVRKTAADLLAQKLTEKIIEFGASLFDSGDKDKQDPSKQNQAAATMAGANTLGIVAGFMLQQAATQWDATAASLMAAATMLLAANATSAGFASGGPVFGAGTSTSDSISARLSNGEYVLNAHATRAVGMETLNAINFGRNSVAIKSLRGRAPGFASGGPVMVKDGGASVHGHIGISLDPGLILDTLESPEGQRVALKVVNKNRRGFRNAMGR